MNFPIPAPPEKTKNTQFASFGSPIERFSYLDADKSAEKSKSLLSAKISRAYLYRSLSFLKFKGNDRIKAHSK